ncbi:hypothetical protein H2O64_07180 [Kordia sp. YSTF-M3]|uniref:Six-cysteine peptide SCIFF n=1 Tax=Kordia aestuariivivens TaxID=2759037 RepID=A0ABR7Q7A9_9FLAO|nr:hypothetical protein [Kordia aestuariivivens]MBC8754449.1 hypothetical protein [Kordia aestuariivivens]
MKKQEVRTLTLNKKCISTFKINAIKGGCPTDNCPDKTRDQSCIISCNGACQ